VEVDIVMDATTLLWNDISQQLQDRIEVLLNVERAFVHVDHETTHAPVSNHSIVGNITPGKDTCSYLYARVCACISLESSLRLSTAAATFQGVAIAAMTQIKCSGCRGVISYSG
jgi:hypothetical protein